MENKIQMKERSLFIPKQGTAIFLLIFSVLSVWSLNGMDLFQESGKASSWKTKHGYNLKTGIKRIPSGPDGKNCTEFNIQYKDPSNRIADARWFQIIKPVVKQKSWNNAEFFAFEFCSNKKNGWSLRFGLMEEDGSVFRVPGRPMEILPLEYVKCKYRFSDLVCSGDRNRKFNPAKLSAFRIDGGAPIGSLYLKNLKIGEKQLPGIKPFLRAKLKDCDNRSNTIWKGKETIVLLTGAAPKEISSLNCVIRDYFGKTVLSKNVSAEQSSISLRPGVLPPGYYEVQVYPVRKNSVPENESCIETSGTQIPGLFTFAVAAETKEEIIHDIKRRGMNSFYGIQNPRSQYNTALTTGASWEINMPRWSWHEPEKPQIGSDGLPMWMKKILARGLAPEHLYAICSFVHHDSQVPKWAQVPRTETNKLGIANFDDFIRYVEHYVQINISRYPHMEKRPYELTWEPDLSGANYRKEPPYWTARDTVEFYRILAPVIRKQDPRAQILGPKSTLNLDYVEETLKLGLGRYIDAISMHFYSTPVPEEGNLPRHIARLREMAKQYIGREVEIYNTEGGYHSRINGVNDLKGQAQKLIRYALIMHGEGLKTYLMFYVFDHGLKDYGTWGLYFNPQKWANFAPPELMPKPVAAAYSVTTSLLRGAKPRMHLRWIDTDLWGYVFERDGKPVIALWDPYRTRTIRFPVGNVSTVTQVGFMGRRTKLPVKNGVVNLELSPDVLYLLGTDPELWLNSSMEGMLPDRGIAPLELYLGETSVLPAGKAGAVETFGDLRAELKAGKVQLTVPENASPGVLPLIFPGKNGKTIRFARINPPLVIKFTEMIQKKDQMILNVSIRNTASLAFRGDLKLTSPAGVAEQNVEFPAKKETVVALPVQKITSNFDPLTPFKGELQLKTKGQLLKKDLQFTFLAAFEKGKSGSGALFTDEVRLKGTGASGKEDSAVIKFSRNSKGLLLKIASQDDVFHQQYSDGDLWRNDSIQLAFDTDPANLFEYDELTARTSKKVTSIGLALSPKGPLAHRYLTFNEKILKTGTISGEIPFSVKRTGNVTQYDILIPWEQIGLKPEEAKAGKQLGIALLINDSDGIQTQRKVIPLFGGIFDNSGWRRYGILTLK